MSGPLSLSLARFAEKVKEDADLVVRKVALDCGAKVIVRSPVDRGRFRNNWNFAIGSPDLAITEQVDKSGDAAIARGEKVLLTFRIGPAIYITNSLPYGPRLEFEGWSKQAPAGMVRVTVAEFQRFVDGAVKSLQQ